VNWLLAHVDDPSLDELDSRDYILYLCPASGQLAEILAKFWTDSKVAAPNGAHDSFPHIRLTTFFRVSLYFSYDIHPFTYNVPVISLYADTFTILQIDIEVILLYILTFMLDAFPFQFVVAF